MRSASEAVRATDHAGRTRESSAILTIALCFCAALIEGLDIVAPGIVAPQLVPAFGLTPSQAGRLFSSSTVGLLLGAVYGGWMADRVGRKRILVVSMIVFGAMSIVTAMATTTTMLFVSRFLTGLGLGGALPNLIALSAEAGPAKSRTTLVTLMYSGVPLGGALAGAIGLWGGAAENWRILFYVGGVGPLVVGVLLALLLPESRLFNQVAAARASQAATGAPPANHPGALHALFGAGRWPTTSLLWVSFFCTLLILYLIINWLPLLLVGRGYSRADAAIGTMLLNVGGGVGAIALGSLMDRAPRRRVMVASYLGMAISLLALLYTFRMAARGLVIMTTSAFAVGVFVIGAQLVLYGVAPSYYSTAVRATGVGAAVAAGRVGSIVGPLIAGQLLGAGGNAASVVTVLLPFVGAAGVAALLLLFRPTAEE